MSGTTTKSGNPIVLLQRLNDLLAGRVWVFAVLVTAIYGINVVDYAYFVAFVRDPLQLMLSADCQYLYSSPFNFLLGSVVAQAVGVPAAFFLVSAGGVVALIAAWFDYLRTIDVDDRTVLAYVVLSTPILLVLTRWCGKGDTWLLAAYLMVLRHRAGVLSGVAGFVMIAAHREIGTLILAGHWLLRRRCAPSVIAGMLAGWVAIMIYHHMILPSVPGGRGDYILSHLVLIRGNDSNPILHLVFGLTWFWMFLAVRVRYGEVWRALTVATAGFGFGWLTLDFTRVVLLLCTPLVLQTAEWIAAGPAARRGVAVCWPFPLLFLVQGQVVEAAKLLDSTKWYGWLY